MPFFAARIIFPRADTLVAMSMMMGRSSPAGTPKLRGLVEKNGEALPHGAIMGGPFPAARPISPSSAAMRT